MFQSMALSSLQLFLNQVQSAPEDLKVKVLQVIFDILIVYDEELLLRSEDIVCVSAIDPHLPYLSYQAEKIVTFFLQTLEVEESPAVQAVLCVGISKLMLAGLVTDPRVRASRPNMRIATDHRRVYLGADEHAHDICLAHDGGQSGAQAMPVLLLSSVLLFVRGKSTAHAVGELTLSHP